MERMARMYIILPSDLLKQEFTDYGFALCCVRLWPFLETLNKSNKSKFIAIGTQSEKQFLKTQGLFFDKKIWLLT